MSLSKALELVNSRIEYNQSLLDFIVHASVEEYDGFISDVYRPILALNRYNSVFRQLKLPDSTAYIKIIEEKLKFLSNLQGLLKIAMDPDDKSDLLELVFYINLGLAGEEIKISSYKVKFQTTLDELSQKIKKLNKNHAEKQQITNVEAEYKELELMFKLFNDVIDDYCEYNFFVELRGFLYNSGVLSNMEYDFHPKNYTTENADMFGSINKFKPTNKIKKLQSECVQRVLNASAKINNAKINGFDSNRYFAQITVFMGFVELMKKRPELDGTRGMLLFYRMIYDVKENFGFIESLVDQHLKQLHELQKQQEKTRKAAEAEQKRQLNEFKKQEATKLAEIAKLQEQQALAEKIQKAEFERQLEELNKKQRADIEAQKKLQQIEAKQLKEQKKQEKELEKSKRKREQFMVDLNEDKVAVDENEDTLSRPRFTIDPKLIEDNIAKLEELFDCNTSSFKFSEATTLINRLNGEIVGSAGSHKYIQFNDVIVTSVRITNQSQKFGLAKPHVPELRNNNLTLLRKAIWAVLPEECALKQSWAPPVRGHLKLKP